MNCGLFRVLVKTVEDEDKVLNFHANQMFPVLYGFLGFSLSLRENGTHKSLKTSQTCRNHASMNSLSMQRINSKSQIEFHANLLF